MKLLFLLLVTLTVLAATPVVALRTDASSPHRVRARLAPPTPERLGEDALTRMKSSRGQMYIETAEVLGVSCKQCETYAQLAIDIISNPTLWNATTEDLTAACAKKFPKSKTNETACALVVALLHFAMPLAVDGLKDLGWDIPFNLCALFVHVCTQPCCLTQTAPEQIHLSLPDSSDFTQMRVTWATLDAVPNPIVQYRLNTSSGSSITHSAAATTRTYHVAGWIGIIYSAVMTNLEAGSTYTYSVGGSDGNAASQSDTFPFNTFPTNIGTPARPLRIISIADMGQGPRSDATVSRMTEAVQQERVDLLIHSGDIAYADGYQKHWDMFMRKVQPIAVSIPYMTGPGNHEIFENFTAYQARYADAMPKPKNQRPNSMFYSLNIGPVKILMLDSETFIDTADITKENIAWATAELADLNRTQVPWALAFHHRPLYCTNGSRTNCEIFSDLLRDEVEDVYIKGKVDFVGTGHLHYYLRSYPIAHGHATSFNYNNPTSPVYVINGAAGNHEINPGPNVTTMYAAGTAAVGYSLINIASDVATNTHSLTSSFYLSDDDSLFDQFTITKHV